MTFHAKLTELIEKATKGPWVVKNGNITTIPRYSRWGAGLNESGMVHKRIAVQSDNAELITYLVNHAEAIRDLVVAAEEVIQHRDTAATISLVEALDKLEEA